MVYLLSEIGNEWVDWRDLSWRTESLAEEDLLWFVLKYGNCQENN